MLLDRWDVKPSSNRKRTDRSVSLPAVVAALAVCCGLAAQKYSKSATDQGDAANTIRIQTNLVIVRVVVRDANGNPVSGLGRSDFHVFDDKKEEPIAYFSAGTAPALAATLASGDKESAAMRPAPTAAPAASAPPQSFTALFFDDYHMQFGNLVQIREAAKQYLETILDQGARVAIYTTSGGAHIAFTNDRAKLEQALTNLRFNLHAEPPDECPPMTDLQTEEIEDNHSIEGGSVAPLSGHGGGGLTPRQHPAARSASTSGAPGGALGPLAIAVGVGAALGCPSGDLRARANYIMSYDNQDAGTTLKALNGLVQRMAQTPGGERTIAMVSQGFLNQRLQEQLNALIDRALRAKVIINALDANGLYTPEGTLVYSDLMRIDPTGKLSSAYAKLQVDSADSDADVMAQVAEGTGGIFIKNNNDFEGGLRKMSAPYTTYNLGFSPANFKFDGKFHRLEVTLTSRENYTVQARRGYFASKQAEDVATAENDELEQAMFSEDDMNGLPVRFSTQFSKLNPQTTKFSVTVRMDTQSLRFRKEDGRNLDDVIFMLALFDSDGNYVTGQKKTINMHLSDATLRKLGATGATITAAVSVKPGSYLVRGVLLDADSQHLGSGAENITIP